MHGADAHNFYVVSCQCEHDGCTCWQWAGIDVNHARCFTVVQVAKNTVILPCASSTPASQSIHSLFMACRGEECSDRLQCFTVQIPLYIRPAFARDVRNAARQIMYGKTQRKHGVLFSQSIAPHQNQCVDPWATAGAMSTMPRIQQQTCCIATRLCRRYVPPAFWLMIDHCQPILHTHSLRQHDCWAFIM